ncbi:type I methionyl aminopeptidase [Patescibacteria group bacterium]|nr:type I methionyl aminopeptidase [Patescibacteria group bacterium]
MLMKSKNDIREIKKGGKILGEILEKLASMCKPGVSTGEIDRAAEKMILAAGGRPAFKGYKNHPGDVPFPSTICASANNELVHGIASNNAFLDEGDIFSIDIGMEYPVGNSKSKSKKSNVKHGAKGFFTDTAITVAVGNVPKKTLELMRVTKEALEIGIKAVRPGNSVADIGKAIEGYVNSQGKYGVVRDLVGHGVGHEVHEEPRIPNYFDPKLSNFILKPCMVLAIEPMISLGSHKVKTGPDGWTIVMSDGSLCAHYEHTLVVVEDGCEVITRRPKESF